MSARQLAINWRLRQLMAEQGMFSTTDLVGPLSDRGVKLSREQVYRLVTQTPLRLNLDVLAAVCDILQCQPNDLLEVVTVARQPRAKPSKAVGDDAAGSRPATKLSPVPARVRRPGRGR